MDEEYGEEEPTAEHRLVCSVVVPCYDEEDSIRSTVLELTDVLLGKIQYEIIVVDDGSLDRTPEILSNLQVTVPHLRVVSHDTNRGYGAALKTGIRAAKAPLIAITDADGTYPNERLPDLIGQCANNDMVVWRARGPGVNYSKIRAFPKFFLRRWISFIARCDVPDINSGMRVFRKDISEQFF